jgi:hypothetical protein
LYARIRSRREAKHGEEIHPKFVVASGHASEALQPGDTALDQVAPWRFESRQPEDILQHMATEDTRHAFRLAGSRRLDHTPIEDGQIVSPVPRHDSAFVEQRKVLALGDDLEHHRPPEPPVPFGIGLWGED